MICLILLVIVLLIAYVLYTKYYKGSVKEHFSSIPVHNPEGADCPCPEYLYTPYPEIRFFNKHDYAGGRVLKNLYLIGGWLKGEIRLNADVISEKLSIQPTEITHNGTQILLHSLDFEKIKYIKLQGESGIDGSGQLGYMTKHKRSKLYYFGLD